MADRHVVKNIESTTPTKELNKHAPHPSSTRDHSVSKILKLGNFRSKEFQHFTAGTKCVVAPKAS
jgi:hypothetical protein